MHQQKCWCIFILCRYLEYNKPKRKEKALSDKTWTVWVDGSEVIDYLVTREEAQEIADNYKEDGYEEVIIEQYTQTEGNSNAKL